MICLNMIVKNEASTIPACLKSVRRHIDQYAIVDTGSADGTQQVIMDGLRPKPGLIVEHPWSNDFAEARNKALQIAPEHGFLMLIDADERVEAGRKPLTEYDWDAHDIWMAPVQLGDRTFPRPFIVRAGIGLRWSGKRDEQLVCDKPLSWGTCSWVTIKSGAKTKSANALDLDIEAMLEQVEAEPHNLIHRYHLAERLRIAGRTEEALAQFLALYEFGNDGEHRWHSAYMAGRCMIDLGWPIKHVENQMLRAHFLDRSRAEPLAWLAKYCLDHCEPSRAMDHLTWIANAPNPAPDALLVERDLYNGGISLLVDKALRMQ